MKKTAFIFIAIGVLAFSAFAADQGPTRSRDLIAFYGDIRGGACSAAMPGVGMITANTSPQALLFNRTFRGQPNPVHHGKLDGVSHGLAPLWRVRFHAQTVAGFGRYHQT